MTFFSDGDSGTPSPFVQAANTWYDIRDTYIVRFVAEGCRKNLPLAAATDMADSSSSLKSQFDGDDGSFLIRLRCENTWDRDAFDRLVHAMKACCISSADSDTLDRWIADGFWDAEHSARDWISQSDSVTDPYYQSAIELLHELAYWYFRGESPAGPDSDPNSYPLTLPD